MPRLPRLHVPGGCYHVVMRGNHREDFFATPHDRHVLNDIVAEALMDTGARLHAFCWMTNHLHALIQIGKRPLGKLMPRIATQYSRHRHRVLSTTGHLFERRYKAWLVEADVYFVTLLQYIHLNPVRARMVTKANDYEWSSHHAYLGNQVLPWVTTEFGLSLLGQTTESARAEYAMLITQSRDTTDAIADEINTNDRRVLGTDKFVAALSPAPFRPRSLQTLEQVTEQVCGCYGVSVDEAKSTEKSQLLTTVRVEIARRATEGRIASQNQAARFLNRSESHRYRT